MSTQLLPAACFARLPIVSLSVCLLPNGMQSVACLETT